jgi:hypothetical protein
MRGQTMHEVSEQCAWHIVRQCARLSSQACKSRDFIWNQGQLLDAATDQVDAAEVILRCDEAGRWNRAGEVPEGIADLFDLYLPICAASPEQPLT